MGHDGFSLINDTAGRRIGDSAVDKFLMRKLISTLSRRRMRDDGKDTTLSLSLIPLSLSPSPSLALCVSVIHVLS